MRRQTVFDAHGPADRIDLFVVANGCTDSTLERSREWVARLKFPDFVRFHPVELEIASKTNAWNVFMHDLLPDGVDVVCLLDGDIRLPQADLIAGGIAALAAHAEAIIASDVSVNDYTGAARLNPMRLLNRVFQRPPGATKGMCGQFYCARAPHFRKIVLPVGLLSQDGYLGAMVATDALTRLPGPPGRIVNVPGGYHLHPAYVSLARMYRFQKRQAIGTALNRLIYQEMEKMPAGYDLRMAEIARRNRADPDWVRQLIAARARETRSFVPRSYVFRRFHAVRNAGFKAGLKWLVMPLAVLFDYVTAHYANAEIRSLSVGSVQANQGKFKIRQ
ncbi:hypothetical protein U879_12350 [Defluviimonas sp. 20V17]|nr:hypothetical protein U879_12350 [Defluviimonas sp. 20V17]